MAEEKDDHQAPVNEIEEAAEAEAGDEMKAIDDSDSSPGLDILVNSPELEKSKGKGKGKGKKKKRKKRKSKALLLSSPTAAVPLPPISPSPPPSTSKDKRPRLSLVFEETGDDFTIHQLTVNPGEDLVKVMEKFNRHYKHRNICIISVSGTVSKVAIDDSPSPLKYEHGRDEKDEQLQLLSLSLRPIVKGNGDSQNCEENKLVASLSTFGGTVVGGTLVGPLIAASPIHIYVGTSKRTVVKTKNITPGESSSANQNINLASENVGVVQENVSANPNISCASKDAVAGIDDQAIQQLKTDPNNVDTDEYGVIMN